jgi:hypothetical protein
VAHALGGLLDAPLSRGEATLEKDLVECVCVLDVGRQLRLRGRLLGLGALKVAADRKHVDDTRNLCMAAVNHSAMYRSSSSAWTNARSVHGAVAEFLQ